MGIQGGADVYLERHGGAYLSVCASYWSRLALTVDTLPYTTEDCRRRLRPGNPISNQRPSSGSSWGKQIWAVPCEDPNSPALKHNRPSSWLCGVHDDESLFRCEEKYIIPDARPIVISLPSIVESPCPSPRVSHLLPDANRHHFEVCPSHHCVPATGRAALPPAAKSGPCVPFPPLRPSTHSPPRNSEWTATVSSFVRNPPLYYFFYWKNIHLHVKFTREN